MGFEDKRGDYRGEEGSNGSGFLIGRTVDGKYRVEELIGATRKSWVYRAREVGAISPGRDVALKVLKPGQELSRFGQFSMEVGTLAELGLPKGKLRHPNIVTVYGGGIDNLCTYIAMEYVPGKNLEERVREGETFPVGRIVDLLHSLADVMVYCHEQGVEHNDLKLKNLTVRDGGCIALDFGSKFTRDENSNDVFAMGRILGELLEHRDNKAKKVSKGLVGIVDRAKGGEYVFPGEFKRALSRYKNRITRRAVLIGGAAVAAGFYGVYLHGRLTSLGHLVEKIDRSSPRDFEMFLAEELRYKLLEEKVRRLRGDGKVLPGQYLYAISEGKKEWDHTDGSAWTSGFWPGMNWMAYSYGLVDREKVMELLEGMPFTPRDESSINTIRFYHSHLKGYQLTQDARLLATARKAAKLIAGRFDHGSEFLRQINGDLENDSGTRMIGIDVMTTALPLLGIESAYNNLISSHCYATERYNLNSDGSTVQMVEFDPVSHNRIGGIKLNGFSEESCLSRGQARAIEGFVNAYKATGEERFLKRAMKCADYFITHLPDDRVPFYDFKDPNKDIPRDSSAAAIGAHALLDLAGVSGKESYRRAAILILHSLATHYLSTDPNYQGSLRHACINKNKSFGHDCSVIYGDYPFLDALGKI